MASSINLHVQAQQTSLKSRPLSRQKLYVSDERSTSPRTANYRPSTVSRDFRTKLFEFSFRKISQTSNSCLYIIDNSTLQLGYPLALRWWNLVGAIASCWSFIAVLQYILIRSQRDGGIIFATNINDLSLGLALSYRYLPTLLAVNFSIVVLWIDSDARRYERSRLMLRCGLADPLQEIQSSRISHTTSCRSYLSNLFE